MKDNRVIIFDLDGTLLDTLDDLTNAVNYALKQYDYPTRTKDEIRSFIGNGVKKLVERSLPNQDRYEEVLDCFRNYYKEHSNDYTRPYDGIIDELKKLKKKGYKIAIASNKIDGVVKDLSAMYFSGLVDVALGTSDIRLPKPNPSIINEIIEEFGCDRKDVIYFGDSEVDIKTCETSNIKGIFVSWGFRSREQLLSLTDNIIDEVKDISKII